MVSNNMIQNCPITDSDGTNSHTKFDSDLADTRFKKMQQNPERVVMDYIAVPREYWNYIIL